MKHWTLQSLRGSVVAASIALGLVVMLRGASYRQERLADQRISGTRVVETRGILSIEAVEVLNGGVLLARAGDGVRIDNGFAVRRGGQFAVEDTGTTRADLWGKVWTRQR